MSVGPQARALPVPMMVASNGGPAGSIAMIAGASCRRQLLGGRDLLIF